jgi:hypothetical protein
MAYVANSVKHLSASGGRLGVTTCDAEVWTLRECLR